MSAYTDLTLAALVRELGLANARADEAERFTINFAALAPFARPDELPPLRRFIRSAPRRNRWAPPPAPPRVPMTRPWE